MNFISIALLALAMSTDAFAAAVAKGAQLRKPHWREAFRTSAWLNMYRPNKKTKYSARDEIRSWPHEDEVAQMKKMWAMEGVAPTPPANWLPEDEEFRKLLGVPAPTRQ